jgi:hypothetical protein
MDRNQKKASIHLIFAFAASSITVRVYIYTMRPNSTLVASNAYGASHPSSFFSKTVKPNFITREQRNYKSSITVTTQPPKRNRHADSHIGMNTEGSNQRVNLTDEPLLAQNKNSKNRSSQPADTKSPISLNLLHARWQNILPAHRLRSVL